MLCGYKDILQALISIALCLARMVCGLTSSELHTGHLRRCVGRKGRASGRHGANPTLLCDSLQH